MPRVLLTLVVFVIAVFGWRAPALAQTSCVTAVEVLSDAWVQGTLVMSATGKTGLPDVRVVAPPDCAWTAETTTPWILGLPRSGTGEDVFLVSVSPNSSTRVRYGSIFIGGQTLPVIQANTSESVSIVGGGVETRAMPWTDLGTVRIALSARELGPISAWFENADYTFCAPCPAGGMIDGWVKEVSWGQGSADDVRIQGIVYDRVYWRVRSLRIEHSALATLPATRLSRATVNVPVTLTATVEAYLLPPWAVGGEPFYVAEIGGTGLWRHVLHGEPGNATDWAYTTVYGNEGTWGDFNNRAFHAPVSASAKDSRPADAVDGDPLTAWTSGRSAGREWFITDLGEPFLIDRILFSSDWSAANYTIATSLDAEHWAPVFATNTGQHDIWQALGPGRYVRVYIPGGAAVGQYQLSEFSVYGERPTNLALGRAVSTSSRRASAFRITDGNIGTTWTSAAADPQWLQVDLGALRTVTRLVFRWGSNPARTYTVLSSNDGQSWTEVFHTTSGSASTQEVPLPGIGARYLLVYAISPASATGGYTLGEIEVY